MCAEWRDVQSQAQELFSAVGHAPGLAGDSQAALLHSALGNRAMLRQRQRLLCPEAPGRVHAGVILSGEWFSGVLCNESLCPAWAPLPAH